VLMLLGMRVVLTCWLLPMSRMCRDAQGRRVVQAKRGLEAADAKHGAGSHCTTGSLRDSSSGFQLEGMSHRTTEDTSPNVMKDATDADTLRGKAQSGVCWSKELVAARIGCSKDCSIVISDSEDDDART
jgi:hypothetical protein